MKLLAVFAVFVALLVVGAQVGSALFASVSGRANTAATFINDSVVVDVGDAGDDDGEDTDEDIIEDTVPEESIGGDTIIFSDDDDAGESVIDTVVVVVSSDEDEGAPGDVGGAGADDVGGTGAGGTAQEEDSSSTTQQTVSAESILHTLTGNQAITTTSVGGSGTSVSGDKTRTALLSRRITSITIPDAPGSSSAVQSRLPYSRADLALIVSAALVQNPDIADVFYSTDALSVTYTARGRLLFAIPVPYTATLDMKFVEPTTKERVRVTFPWYKFLMYTGVSKGRLRADVDEVITRSPEGHDYDRAAHIFTEVANLLATTRGFRAVQ